jgi:hypothetical protein
MTSSTFSAEQIKAKMAKLLALQGSSNANEAANAAAFLDKLAREYGISPSEIKDFEEQDPERDTVVHEYFCDGARVSEGDKFLLQGVVKYYNGEIISTARENGGRGNRLDVWATQGNMMQIQIYYQYLLDQMELAGQAEKVLAMMRGQNVQGFMYNFKKGFGLAVYRRLEVMKQDKELYGIAASPEHGQSAIPGLVVTEKGRSDLAKASRMLALAYPKLKYSSAKVQVQTGRNGYSAGRAAGNSVSLNKQVSGSGRKQLSGY